MGGRIFWDVDTQYDFMRADGKLYVPGAEEIIPRLKRLRDHARGSGVRTVATADDHTDADVEISDAPDFAVTFPPHCMRGTSGQLRIPETVLDSALVIDAEPADRDEIRARVRDHGGDIVLHKHTVDIFTNPNTEAVLEELDPEEIVLFGVALDYCNRYAVEGLLQRCPRARVTVVTDAVRAIDAREGEALLARWKERGVRVATTDDVLADTVEGAVASERSP